MEHFYRDVAHLIPDGFILKARGVVKAILEDAAQKEQNNKTSE